MSNVGSLIVSWDFSHGKDHDILLVGQQKDGKVDIVNAFLNEDARDIYKRLTTVKKGEANE